MTAPSAKGRFENVRLDAVRLTPIICRYAGACARCGESIAATEPALYLNAKGVGAVWHRACARAAGWNEAPELTDSPVRRSPPGANGGAIHPESASRPLKPSPARRTSRAGWHL